MPPQPLSRVKSGVGFSLTATGFDQRPGVAQGIAQCIAYWSWVETQTSRLFVLLLGGNRKDGTAHYNALESAKGKRDAIQALALSSLKAEDYRIVLALLRLIKSHQSTRDRIAHWFWGLPTELPDAMVLVDPKILINQHGQALTSISEGRAPSYDELRIRDEDVFVYHPADLEADARNFGELAILINRVAQLLWPPRLDNERCALLRAELTKDDRLAKYLSPSS